MPIPAPLFLMLAWRKLTECNIADFLDSPQNPPPTAFWTTCHFCLALWLPPYPHLHDILSYATHCIWYSPWYVSLLAGESLTERFWFQDPKSNILPRCWISWSKYCCLLISIIILYYQKVVNLPFFVTEKTQTKAFTMIYKQKVVVLPLFVTFPFSRSPKMTLSLSNIFPRRNDGNSIYTNRILMGCLRNKDPLRSKNYIPT